MKNPEFEIMQNAEGKIAIVFKSLPYEPKNPRFVYDGGEQLVCMLCNDYSYSLVIAPEIRRFIHDVHEVLVAEVEGEDIAREYLVPIDHVNDMSVYVN